MIIMPSPTSYPDWKAPAEDGEILIWPPFADIIQQTRANKTKFDAMPVPLREIRRRARNWLGQSNDDLPIIASGHQTELYHPGVWAKDVLANQLAAKLDGAAMHFAVDTDSPKHLHLRWPNGSALLTDDPSLPTAEWA